MLRSIAELGYGNCPARMVMNDADTNSQIKNVREGIKFLMFDPVGTVYHVTMWLEYVSWIVTWQKVKLKIAMLCMGMCVS